MLCSPELQVLLNRRLHISEGPALADAKSARSSARSARPHESPAWVEDVVARRKAELEELDCFEAADEQACLLEHFKDRLASESVHVEELSQKLQEQQLGREMDAAHALSQRNLLRDEYEEYGARKHGLAEELEIEFREEYATYQARSLSLKAWQTEFSTECSEFGAHNRGLIESQNRLQDECRAYGAHCCSLVEMQAKLRSELDEYKARNLSLGRWQTMFQQECEEFGARNRHLTEWRTKFAEESEECAAQNRDLAQQQTNFADECAEFKTRNRSLTEWQSRFADEYTEYKMLNRSLAKQHEKLRVSSYQDSLVGSSSSHVAPRTQQDVDHQATESFLRRALACHSVPIRDVRTAICCMEELLQESKLELAARELSEKREAAQGRLHTEGWGGNALSPSAHKDEKAMSQPGCLEDVMPGNCVQDITSIASTALEDQKICKDAASVISSASNKEHCAAANTESLVTHLPDFDVLAPIAPPIGKCADACSSTVKSGMQPPSLTMEAATLSFPAVSAELPDTPRMVVSRRLPITPTETA